MKLKILTTIVALFAMLTAGAQQVLSPNGNVQVKFSLDQQGCPTYEMLYKGKQVIKPSHMGFDLAPDKHASKGMAETDLLDGFSIAGSQVTSHDDTWTPVWGQYKSIRNNYNELTVDLYQASANRYMTLRFRVYDDGIGFRYEFPQQRDLNYFIIKKNGPHQRMPRTFEGTIFEVGALFLVIALWAVAVYMYQHAPESIPTHFDLQGNPNN